MRRSSPRGVYLKILRAYEASAAFRIYFYIALVNCEDRAGYGSCGHQVATTSVHALCARLSEMECTVPLLSDVERV